MQSFRLLCLLATSLLGLVALAQVPVAWPDNGNADYYLGWSDYTMKGNKILDLEGRPDDVSNGGTSPTQEADISYGTRADGKNGSVYYAYDSVNDVLFLRCRVNSRPIPISVTGSDTDPFNAVQWTVAIDVDHDGWKEYYIALDGRSGQNGHTWDDIVVYYEDLPQQNLTAGATITYNQKTIYKPTPTSAIDADARAAVYDFRRTRTINDTTSGGDWLLDWQVPLSAFTGVAKPVTESTPIAFCYMTANSNTDPFQKDVVYQGTFNALSTKLLPFGDATRLVGGIQQNPIVEAPVIVGERPSDVSSQALDTIIIVNDTPTSTIKQVDFYYYPDADCNGVPDAGSTPTLIGTATTSVAGDISKYQVTWNNQSLPKMCYDVYAVATDTDGNTGTSAYTTYCPATEPPGVDVSGTVYHDLNHDSAVSGGEGGLGIAGLFVKAVPAATPSGPATAAASVDVTSGSYTLTGIPAGTYTLILDNNASLTDVTAYRPPEWIGTEAPNQTIASVVVGAAAVTGKNMGLFHGSKVTGTVYNDNGIGAGGTANDAVRNGSEAGLDNVLVKVTNTVGTTTYVSDTTDASGNFTLWVPSTAGATSLKIVEQNTTGYLSTGGTVTTPGASYDRPSDTVTFPNTLGTVFSNVVFADIPVNTFTIDGNKTTTAGTVVLYPHVYTANSPGTVTFSTTDVQNPPVAGWNNLLFRDSNENGQLDGGEPQITTPIAMARGDHIAILVKVFVPTNAQNNSSDTVTVRASYAYDNANPALTADLTRADMTLVTEQQSLTLQKSVDKSTAVSGTTIVYTVTYTNISGQPLSNIVIADSTPAFTTFQSVGFGSLPSNLTGCTPTTPAVGATGTIQWSFTGQLSPGSSGTVTFSVKVN
jgi:uncharacterized repeat protein (TIGR01451 family)